MKVPNGRSSQGSSASFEQCLQMWIIPAWRPSLKSLDAAHTAGGEAGREARVDQKWEKRRERKKHRNPRTQFLDLKEEKIKMTLFADSSSGGKTNV